MIKIETIIKLLNREGKHNIKYRNYCSPSGMTKFYIENIDGVEYRIVDQKKARVKLDDILEELDE